MSSFNELDKVFEHSFINSKKQEMRGVEIDLTYCLNSEPLLDKFSPPLVPDPPNNKNRRYASMIYIKSIIILQWNTLIPKICDKLKEGGLDGDFIKDNLRFNYIANDLEANAAGKSLAQLKAGITGFHAIYDTVIPGIRALHKTSAQMQKSKDNMKVSEHYDRLESMVIAYNQTQILKIMTNYVIFLIWLTFDICEESDHCWFDDYKRKIPDNSGAYNIDERPTSKQCFDSTNMIPPTLRKLFQVDKMKIKWKESQKINGYSPLYHCFVNMCPKHTWLKDKKTFFGYFDTANMFFDTLCVFNNPKSKLLQPGIKIKLLIILGTDNVVAGHILLLYSEKPDNKKPVMFMAGITRSCFYEYGNCEQGGLQHVSDFAKFILHIIKEKCFTRNPPIKVLWTFPLHGFAKTLVEKEHFRQIKNKTNPDLQSSIKQIFNEKITNQLIDINWMFPFVLKELPQSSPRSVSLNAKAYKPRSVSLNSYFNANAKAYKPQSSPRSRKQSVTLTKHPVPYVGTRKSTKKIKLSTQPLPDVGIRKSAKKIK